MNGLKIRKHHIQHNNITNLHKGIDLTIERELGIVFRCCLFVCLFVFVFSFVVRQFVRSLVRLFFVLFCFLFFSPKAVSPIFNLGSIWLCSVIRTIGQSVWPFLFLTLVYKPSRQDNSDESLECGVCTNASSLQKDKFIVKSQNIKKKL